MLLFRVIVILSVVLAGFAPISQAASPQSVQFVSQPGVLGPEFLLSAATTPDVNRYLPASAYNSTTGETLVVWHRTAGSSYVIEGRLVKNGASSGSAPVILVSNSVMLKQPAVVYNSRDNQYLVVWMKNVAGDGLNFEIWGMKVNANLSIAVADFQIASSPDRTFWTPRLAWNSKWDEYLVFWNAFSKSTGLAVALSNAIILSTGEIIPMADVTTVGFPHNVDVVYNPATDEYFAAWRVMGTGVSYGQIYAARLDGNNAMPLPSQPPFQLNPSTNDQRAPRIATNGVNSYMVVWEELYTNNNWYVFGREINLAGIVYGYPHLISVSAVSTEEAYPTVAGFPGSASRYVAAYQVKTATGTAVLMAYKNNNTNTLDLGGYTCWLDSLSVMDAGFWNATTPTVAMGGPGAVIAYQGISAGDPTSRQHIFARFWTPNQVYVPAIRK